MNWNLNLLYLGMKEILIKGNKGKVCFDTNTNSDKLRLTAVDDEGVADSHYVFNQEAISNCNSLTYNRKGGRTI